MSTIASHCLLSSLMLNLKSLLKKKRVIYTANFGDYDNYTNSADKIFNEENNVFDGCSEHLSPRLMAKLYKVLNPLDYDIWVDSNLEILDRKGFEKLFSGDLCVFKHPFNQTIRDEINACKDAGYINDKQIENIEELYKSGGLSVDTTPVYASGIIYRAREAKEFNRLWWELICTYSYRDQLTFSFALSKFPELDFREIDINVYNMDGVINPYFLFNPHK